MRVELPIVVQIRASGDAKAPGTAKLYEGTSEKRTISTARSDVDPHPARRLHFQGIHNTDEGGDFCGDQAHGEQLRVLTGKGSGPKRSGDAAVPPVAGESPTLRGGLRGADPAEGGGR